MSKALAIVKNSGHDIPSAFLAKVLAQYTSQYGVAIIETDGATKILRCDAFAAKGDLKEIEEALATAKDDTVLLTFGEGEVPSAELLQPYIALGTDENPLVVVAMDGLFDVVVEGGVPTSAAILEEEIKPKLEQLYEQSGKDIVKFMDLLRDPLLAKQFNRLAIGDAQMIFFSVTGELMNFCKSDKFRSFDWGKVTDALDYTESEFPAKEEAPKKTGLFGRLKNKATGTPKNVAEEKIEPKVDPLPSSVPSVKPDDKKVEVAPDKLPSDGTSMTPHGEYMKKGDVLSYRPPASLSEKNSIKNHYRNNAGTVPQGYRDRGDDGKFQWVTVSPKLLKAGFRSFAGIPKELVKTSDNVNTQKDTSVKHVADVKQPVKEVAKNTTAAIAPDKNIHVSIPVLDLSDQKKMEEFMAKGTVKQALDQNSAAIAEPAKLRSTMESKAPNLAQQMGLDDIHVFYNLPFSALVDMATQHPKAAAILNHNLIVKILEMAGTKSLIPTISAPVEKKEAVADNTAPAKKVGFSGFGRKRA